MAIFAQLLLRYNLPKHNRAAEYDLYHAETQNIASNNLRVKVREDLLRAELLTIVIMCDYCVEPAW